MGSVECKICRDNNEKELEIEQSHKKVENEQSGNLENLASSPSPKVIKSNQILQIEQINQMHPNLLILNNNNSENSSSFISQVHEKITEEIEEKEEDIISESDCKVSQNIFEDGKILKINHTPSVSKIPTEHLEILNEPNENYSDNSLRSRNKSDIPTKNNTNCVLLDEKQKKNLYESIHLNNPTGNELKMKSIDISKIDFTSFHKDQEPGLKIEENLEKIEGNESKIISIHYNKDSKLNFAVEPNKINQNINYLTKSGDLKGFDKKSKDNSYFSYSKKSAYQKDSLDAWKGLSIISIISENKLLNCEDYDILFQSDLLKYTYNKMYKKSAQLYSSKFCVLSKAEFKSKEAFLMLQNPLSRIPLFLIIEINRVNVPSNYKKKIYNFYVEFNEKVLGNELLRSGHEFNQKDLEEKEKNSFDHSREKAIHEENENLKRLRKKKIPTKENKEEKHAENINLYEDFLNSPNCMIFASENDELVNRWVCIINYFLSK